MRGRGVGTCFNRQPEKNRVPQAEGDMTLLVWPGSKLECGFSKERNISERVDGSIHSSTVKLMEPAPPG